MLATHSLPVTHCSPAAPTVLPGTGKSYHVPSTGHILKSSLQELLSFTFLLPGIIFTPTFLTFFLSISCMMMASPSPAIFNYSSSVFTVSSSLMALDRIPSFFCNVSICKKRVVLLVGM